MSALEIVVARLATIKRELEDLDEQFERGSDMEVGAWQRKRRALVEQREVLTRSRPMARKDVDIDRMNDAEFLRYSQERCRLWSGEATAKLEECDAIRREAEAEEERRGLPSDWHATFRGTALDVDLAREQLAAPGFFRKNMRTIEGIAHTPSANTHGYALAMTGGEFDLPIPLLLSHDWHKVIGAVTEIDCKADAIHFKARVAEGLPPALADVWDRIISGELAGISADSSHVGGATHERGMRVYNRWRLCEVSVCERGANPDARILVARETTDDGESILREAGRMRTSVPALSQPSAAPATRDANEEVILRLEKRIADLESRPAVRYRGVFSPDEQYNAGDMATDRGSVWACLRPTRDRPPSPNWQLAVKRGDRGKDAGT